MSSLEVEGKVRVAGISRGGGGFIPTASSTLQAGDYLILMIAKEGLDLVDELIADEDASRMKVVVTGGGAVGRHLAQDLTERGHDVTLVEQRRDLAEKLENWAPDTQVVYGDACEPRILEKADVRSADVVVAATGDDEDNLVTSLLAKQEFGVPRVLARVNHPKNEWLFDEQWGVDASVSPPHILTAMVEEAVTVGDLVRLLRLEGGKVALVEMRLPRAVTQRGQGALRAPPATRHHAGRDPSRGARDDPAAGDGARGGRRDRGAVQRRLRAGAPRHGDGHELGRRRARGRHAGRAGPSTGP